MCKIKCMKGIILYCTYTVMNPERTVTTQGQDLGKTAANSLKRR